MIVTMTYDDSDECDDDITILIARIRMNVSRACFIFEKAVHAFVRFLQLLALILSSSK